MFCLWLFNLLLAEVLIYAWVLLVWFVIVVFSLGGWVLGLFNVWCLFIYLDTLLRGFNIALRFGWLVLLLVGWLYLINSVVIN